jgi:hypothetical protein
MQEATCLVRNPMGSDVAHGTQHSVSQRGHRPMSPMRSFLTHRRLGAIIWPMGAGPGPTAMGGRPTAMGGRPQQNRDVETKS